MFLLSWFGRSNLGRMTCQTFDSEFFHEVQNHCIDPVASIPTRAGRARLEQNSRTLLPPCLKVLFTTSPVLVSSIDEIMPTYRKMPEG